MKTTAKRKQIDPFHATMVCEGVEEATEEHVIECWQSLIDSGVVWQLQGFYGRTARQLIDEGICHERRA